MNILNKRIGFVSLGCDKNRVDLERIIFNVKNAGFKISNNELDCDVVIINTCSFIKPAREESVDTILEFVKLKEEGKLEKIIVTGCLNEMKYSDLNESLPEVDLFLNVEDNNLIVSKIYELYNEKQICKYVFNNNRILSTPSHFAYLKIADGCNNFCSYCTIPFIRGRYKSEKIEDLLKEAQNLCDLGVKEIIIVAQDVTKYGSDLNNNTNLVTLLKELSKIESLKWIRLLYCYPESITDELIQEIKTNNKIVKYIDIPLQHIDDLVLKSMNRKSTNKSVCNLINNLQKEIPNIFIRSTFIIGFPTEDENAFNSLLYFIKEYKLDSVGFFNYSKEDGTVAGKIKKQITKTVKEKRLKQISKLQFDIINDKMRDLIGKVYEVVIDEIVDNTAICRAYFQTPLVDSVILVENAGKHIVGNFYKVKITNTKNYDLKGEWENEESSK